MRKHRHLLQCCRTQGVDEAFSQLIGELDQSRGRCVMAAIAGLFSASTLTALRKHFEMYPELFGDASHPDLNVPKASEQDFLQIIDQIITQDFRDRDQSIPLSYERNIAERNIAILRRARQVGIESAFSEQESSTNHGSIQSHIRSLVQRAGRIHIRKEKMR